MSGVTSSCFFRSGRCHVLSEVNGPRLVGGLEELEPKILQPI